MNSEISHADLTERSLSEPLGGFTAAMRNEQPDCVPIRPFVAEFVSRSMRRTRANRPHTTIDSGSMRR